MKSTNKKKEFEAEKKPAQTKWTKKMAQAKKEAKQKKWGLSFDK